MIKLENDELSVTINEAGAELSSLVDKQTGIEYMWSGDPAYWGKKSPVLFPIVGTLKENRFFYAGNSFALSRHGFARDKQFKVDRVDNSSVLLTIKEDVDTMLVYPFKFQFSLLYQLSKNSLSVTYIVCNNDDSLMYFSVGAHPAFRVPLDAGCAYEDYYLEFNQTETLGRWPISAAGLIEKEALPFMHQQQKIQLDKSLFYKDAIVLKGGKSNQVLLKSDKHPAGLQFSYPGFPYLGIWAAKDADFVCIEPWCGIADSVDTNQHLPEKEGIVSLQPGASFEKTWRVAVF